MGEVTGVICTLINFLLRRRDINHLTRFKKLLPCHRSLSVVGVFVAFAKWLFGFFRSQEVVELVFSSLLKQRHTAFLPETNFFSVVYTAAADTAPPDGHIIYCNIVMDTFYDIFFFSKTPGRRRLVTNK